MFIFGLRTVQIVQKCRDHFHNPPSKKFFSWQGKWMVGINSKSTVFLFRTFYSIQSRIRSSGLNLLISFVVRFLSVNLYLYAFIFQFKRLLNKELSHFSESKSGNQISEYICNTFLGEYYWHHSGQDRRGNHWADLANICTLGWREELHLSCNKWQEAKHS